VGQPAHYLWDSTVAHTWDRHTNCGILYGRGQRRRWLARVAPGRRRRRLTLPELAQLLAAAQDATDVTWLLHAIHRAGRIPTGAAGGVAYLIELADPATGEVRTVPSRAAYHQLRHDDAATPVA
jgi:hypothetical protein